MPHVAEAIAWVTRHHGLEEMEEGSLLRPEEPLAPGLSWIALGYVSSSPRDFSLIQPNSILKFNNPLSYLHPQPKTRGTQ